MKVVRFADKNGCIRYGCLGENGIHLFQLNGLGSTSRSSFSIVPISEARLLAPCEPTKVIVIGRNYKDHAQELTDMGVTVSRDPVLSMKPPSSIIGPEEAIRVPPAVGRVDYEGELVVVIGKKARDVAAGDTSAYIFGYTCGNDVTARDLQRDDIQWTRAKSYDTFCPLGPWIVTGLEANNLRVITRVNNRVVQQGSTSDMIFSCTQLVRYVSQVMTLYPGDVIMTGTPLGVGPIEPGDTVEVEIEKIGSLVNPVIA